MSCFKSELAAFLALRESESSYLPHHTSATKRDRFPPKMRSHLFLKLLNLIIQIQFYVK
ncbi:MAG: hypothetical protein ICV63_14785 [Coleofasciculus sp. Co-bin14]|nr:hypothetical protein [Coleofasciculus sp. Co-bin14]